MGILSVCRLIQKYVSEASLDVTLGYHYYHTERANERTVYNPFDREDVERYFDGPYKAMPHGNGANLTALSPITIFHGSPCYCP